MATMLNWRMRTIGDVSKIIGKKMEDRERREAGRAWGLCRAFLRSEPRAERSFSSSRELSASSFEPRVERS
uniref:Uncharacterized protein n=1 Tax=Cucumis sativus TaxID=3659 RepID=A0A0A0K9D4_CUCSA